MTNPKIETNTLKSITLSLHERIFLESILMKIYTNCDRSDLDFITDDEIVQGWVVSILSKISTEQKHCNN